MTAIGRRIARWGVRFAIAALIYIATVTVWIKNATGWESLGLFVAAIVFGAVAVVAWCAAAAIGHFCVRYKWARPLAHPVLTAALFAILAVVVVSGFFGDSIETAWHDVKPFVVLVAGCALADAAVGFGLERRSSAAPRQAF